MFCLYFVDLLTGRSSNGFVILIGVYALNSLAGVSGNFTVFMYIPFSSICE